jgi:hypothetical protein
MRYSLRDYLEVVTPYLDPKLVSPESLPHIQLITQLLPPVSFAGFECRLGQYNARTDFALGIFPFDAARDILAGSAATNHMPDVLFGHDSWCRLRDFFLHWRDPTSLLHRGIEIVWLEFDVDGPPPDTPIPNLMFRFNSQSRQKHKIIETSLKFLLREPMTPSLQHTLFTCINALPVESKVTLGVMLPRQVDVMRLSIEGIPTGQIPDYLARVGWPGPMDELEAVITMASRFVDTLVLDLDVGSNVFPKIGLECCLMERNPEKEPRWKLLLDQLVQSGLCLPNKRDPLLAWYGSSSQTANGQAWPDNLRQLSSLLGPKVQSVVSRELSHIKLVYVPGSPLDAKAYLGFRYTWRNVTA